MEPSLRENGGHHQSPLEIWGGVEYTCNRVNDEYFDQVELSGHSTRPADYEGFAALGMKTFRFGLLWERYERLKSWSWFDERLHWMKSSGMRPIAGLMHHGSGPEHTSLLDPAYPEKLAKYASAVAERYPWIDAYTPVNEPHTTARFSGMYGIWYPHHRSRRSYLQALLHQLKATVLCMEAIRRVRADAQLIQTEDVGRTDGTDALRSVVEVLSERRWLTFDLLCGRVDRRHPMFRYMSDEGIQEREILWFMDHPCVPSVVGINYYPTSDRYLDHRVDRYSADRRSSEGNFVDVEAVRVEGRGLAGAGSLLLEAWRRYGQPVAITEAHLGGPVHDQIRWVSEVWRGVKDAQARGAECVALTLWALLGSYYWNQLVTRPNGHYEAGVFDVRSGTPVATELSRIVSQMAQGKEPRHAALKSSGWWQDEGRVIYRPDGDTAAMAA